MTRAYMKIALI